jgi:FtsH-binding integral membrane protein
MNASKQTLAAALLFAVALIVCLTFYALRCAASPPVSIKALAIGIAVFGVALVLIYWATSEEVEGAARKLRLSLFWFGVGLFLASLGIAQYALNYSDAIGHPNWYKSVGNQCKSR